MGVIERIANRLRKGFTRPEEMGEYSAGYLPFLVRKKVGELVAARPDRRLLEIGSGEGLFLAEISIKCPVMDVIGLEPWDEILLKAGKRLLEKGLKRIAIVKGISQSIPFRDESFEHVVCINLFLNLPARKDMVETLSEMVRVCKKGGFIYFDFRNILNPLIYAGYKLAPLHDPYIKVPLRMNSLKDIKRILKELGMKKIEHIGIGMPLGRFSPAIVVQGKKD